MAFDEDVDGCLGRSRAQTPFVRRQTQCAHYTSEAKKKLLHWPVSLEITRLPPLWRRVEFEREGQ